MRTALVSVILPIYNAAPYLERCLTSIVNNTYSNLEIICVNDGSTDGSVGIIERFAVQDSRIRMISQQNKGLSAARNAGMDVAKGEFIAFIDSDDWVHERYFEFLYRAICEWNADVAICEMVRTESNHVLCRSVGYSSHLMPISEMATTPLIKDYVWRRLYSRTLIGNLRFAAEQKIEDAAFNFELLSQHPKMRIAYIPAILYGYFIREGSLSTKLNEKHAMDLAVYLASLVSDSCKATKPFVAFEAFRRALHSRYVFAVLRDREHIAVCNAVLRQTVEYLPIKRLIYAVMAYCPPLYRAYRILTDRTLLQYEKSLKDRRNQSDS